MWEMWTPMIFRSWILENKQVKSVFWRERSWGQIKKNVPLTLGIPVNSSRGATAEIGSRIYYYEKIHTIRKPACFWCSQNAPSSGLVCYVTKVEFQANPNQSWKCFLPLLRPILTKLCKKKWINLPIFRPQWSCDRGLLCQPAVAAGDRGERQWMGCRNLWGCHCSQAFQPWLECSLLSPATATGWHRGDHKTGPEWPENM